MIKNVLKEIKEQQEILSRELVVDARTLPAQLGIRAQAEEKLNALLVDLKESIRNNCVFIAASGKNAQTFANIAQEEFGCFAFNAQEPFEKMTENIHDTYIGQHNSPEIINLAMNEFSSIASNIGILGYNYPLFASQDALLLKDRKTLVDAITNIFNRDVGSEFVLYYAINEVAKKLMSLDFEGNKVPIILYSDDSELINTLKKDSETIQQKLFIVECNKKQTTETVEKQLLTIKSELN